MAEVLDETPIPVAIDGDDEIPPVDKPVETIENEAKIKNRRERKRARRAAKKEDDSISEPTTEELESMESEDM